MDTEIKIKKLKAFCRKHKIADEELARQMKPVSSSDGKSISKQRVWQFWKNTNGEFPRNEDRLIEAVNAVFLDRQIPISFTKEQIYGENQ